MVFENIYQLQRQLTDKYVVVDQSRPELQRFGGMTGQVKTVNFSGRALVEFDANNNTGWFDIDPQFLKVIDAPLPKPVAKETKGEKKAAPAKAEKPVEKPAAKPAAAAPKPGGSVADILAAARGGAKPAEAEAKPASKAQSTADILAAARSKPAEAQAPAASETTAKVDPKKLSVADMLAMARGQKPAEGAAAAPVAKPAPEPVAEEPTAVEEAPAEVEEALAAAPAPGKVDRTKMSVDEMVAYCRKVDVK